jgi:hypothetical protein
MTYKEYCRDTYGWTERHFEAERKRAEECLAKYRATVVNGIAPLPKGIQQDRKSKYFEPIERPARGSEEAMFEGSVVVDLMSHDGGLAVQKRVRLAQYPVLNFET